MPEPDRTCDDERLRYLVAQKCNGALTSDEFAELEELLASSDGQRKLYWEYVSIHSALDWEYGSKTNRDQDFAAVVLESEIREPGTRRSGPAWLMAACLLSFISVGGVLLWQLQWDRASGPVAQAVESPTLGTISPLMATTKWSLGRTGIDNPETVFAGDTLWLDQGAAELRLSNDTVATLESPAIVQIVSLGRVRMLSGRITVDVPKGAEGFTVETTSAEVIDLGTTFAVDVVGSATDVIVFQGSVDLRVAKDSLQLDSPATYSTRRIETGEAVRVGGDRTLSRIVNVQKSVFSLVSSDSAPKRGPIISAVTDNLNRDDLWSFYEIVPGGMGEDARAFVDRRFEWNGITPAGLPDYLVGGDYVKTFNNDKVSADLAMEITLNQPAVLYVLLDERATPPQWLRKSFTKTGDKIGVDEAWHDPLNFKPGLEDFAQVGPGRSIERTHSVWKRQVDLPGTVTLGANGSLDDGRNVKRGVRTGLNMYGIVAVPLDDGVSTNP